MAKSDLDVNVCVSRPNADGREKVFHSSARQMVNTLKIWKRELTPNVMITWGKTDDKVIDCVEKILHQNGIAYHVPCGNRSVTDKKIKYREGVKGLGRNVACLNFSLIILSGMLYLPVIFVAESLYNYFHPIDSIRDFDGARMTMSQYVWNARAILLTGNALGHLCIYRYKNRHLALLRKRYAY